MKALALLFIFLIIIVAAGGLLWYLVYEKTSQAPPSSTVPPSPTVPPSASARPFWGCGLVGKDIDPSKKTWKDLATALQKNNDFGKVSTWNWATTPQSGENLDETYLFFPESQCGGISMDQGQGFPNPGDAVIGAATVATMALGANEPDQKAFCQTYGPEGHPAPGPLANCDSERMRRGGCTTGANECYCSGWTEAQGCKYDVTGCGMWPVKSEVPLDCSEGETAPFPYQCFGTNKKICSAGPAGDCCETKCRQAAARNFNAFYQAMGNQGYTYATAPLIASDMEFSRDIMQEAGCNADKAKQAVGTARLKQGCPTHSAFHFYSMGCPNKDGTSIADFTGKVAAAKKLNNEFNLAGTVVNELGSLNPQADSCDPQRIADMMGDLFEHLQTDDAKGVVSQMVWFNQDKTGGTYDLRLVDDDAGKLTPLGEQYQKSCSEWFKNHA